MKHLLFLGYLLAWFACPAAAQDHKDIIKLTAQLMEDAAVKEDWPAVLDHIYPKYIDAYGGKDGLLSKYKSQWEFMNSNGNEFSIKKITVGDPNNEVKIGKMLYSFVPETRIFRLNGTNYQMVDYLIGISSDGGEHWTFLVGQKINVIKALLPDINKLNIPKAGTPKALAK